MNLSLDEQIDQCSLCQHIGRPNDHLYYVQRTRRFLPGQNFPRRRRPGGDMRNSRLRARWWKGQWLDPRRRMQDGPGQIPRRRMQNLPRQISRLGRDRPRAIGVNGNRIRRQTRRRLGVGVVDGVEQRLDLLEAQTRYENANTGDRRHAVPGSKFCGQTRAGFAPAIKITRNIAGNKVLCDQSP
jgi:hypothetical protein